MKILFLLTFLFVLHFCNGSEYKRDIAMPFAAAAYSSNPNLCLSNIYKLLNPTLDPSYNITVYRKYTVNCGSFNNTCSAYIAISSFTKEIIIAFRGPSNFDQLLKHGWNSDEMVPFVTDGQVGKYFYDGFSLIWQNSEMRNDFYALKNRFPNYIYIFVGHSIGGSLASLTASAVVSTGVLSEDKISVFTFGQPRTGDKYFADGFNSLEIQTSRIVHKNDIFPHLPTLTNSTYFHHRQEIWYNNDMGIRDDFTTCSYETGEDPSCSDSVDPSKLNIKDHKYYYGRDFVQYGISGCPDLVASRKSDLEDSKFVEKRSRHFSRNF